VVVGRGILAYLSGDRLLQQFDFIHLAKLRAMRQTLGRRFQAACASAGLQE
jgi:hypothetical protein